MFAVIITIVIVVIDGGFLLCRRRNVVGQLDVESRRHESIDRHRILTADCRCSSVVLRHRLTFIDDRRCAIFVHQRFDLFQLVRRLRFEDVVRCQHWICRKRL